VDVTRLPFFAMRMFAGPGARTICSSCSERSSGVSPASADVFTPSGLDTVQHDCSGRNCLRAGVLEQFGYVVIGHSGPVQDVGGNLPRCHLRVNPLTASGRVDRVRPLDRRNSRRQRSSGGRYAFSGFPPPTLPLPTVLLLAPVLILPASPLPMPLAVLLPPPPFAVPPLPSPSLLFPLVP
jgi:hypothetical protein